MSVGEKIERLWWRWSARFMYDSDALIDLVLITIATLLIVISAIALLGPLLLQAIASSVSIT